jgi:hypothetical protein
MLTSKKGTEKIIENKTKIEEQQRAPKLKNIDRAIQFCQMEVSIKIFV